jgi:HPt (histidine-containing phosphotransfer) domain-containing protein
MNPPTTTVDLAELDALQRELGDDRESIPAMIAMFVADAPAHLAGLAAAVQAEEPVAIGQAAHRLKGATRVLGLAATSAACQELEDAARAGRGSGLQAGLEAVRAALAAALPALQAWRPEFSRGGSRRGVARLP